jgi:hypothetical protein
MQELKQTLKPFLFYGGLLFMFVGIIMEIVACSIAPSIDSIKDTDSANDSANHAIDSVKFHNLAITFVIASIAMFLCCGN